MRVMTVIFLAWQSHSSPTTVHQSQLVLAEPSVHCSLEYATTWVTDYKELETEECQTEYESICVTETNVVCVDSVVTQCDTVTTSKCHTEYNTVCTDQTRLELEPFIETECQVLYKTECDYRWEGEGNDKVSLARNVVLYISILLRSGYRYQEHARRSPTRTVWTWPRPRRERSPTLSVRMSPLRSVSRFPNRDAEIFLTRNVHRSRTRSAR